MLEILLLIFLCSQNGKLAMRKGLKAGTWWLYTVLAWIGAEILGISFCVFLLGSQDLIGLMLMGLASGFGGYLIIRVILKKKPDAADDEIENIGRDN